MEARELRLVGRDIPEGVKRAVRKKSGFGCIICGLPVYHYEHVEEFAIVRRHDASNIVLLCPNHHQEKTSQRLSKEVLRHYASCPHNISKLETKAHSLLMRGNTGRFVVGGNIYDLKFSEVAQHFSAISMHGREMLGLHFERGSLLLDMAFSDFSGNEILVVRRGEMCVSTGIWDYRIEGSQILIHSAERNVGLEMSLTANGVDIRRGTLYGWYHKIVIEPDCYIIHPSMSRFEGCRASNCRVGLSIN